MTIIDKTNWHEQNSCNATIQEVYSVLTHRDECFDYDEESVNKDTVNHIIAWLPNIKEIAVMYRPDNNYVFVEFMNGETVSLCNIGIEDVVRDLAASDN